MRIALIGDVHGNLPALEAVLADARRRGAERIWNIGDFVGYGAFPEECVIAIRQAGAVSISGNYDLKALDASKRKTKASSKQLAFQWAHDHLSPQSRQYLLDLPQQKRLSVVGWRVLLCHGSPASIDEHLMPDTPAARLAELAKAARADIVICGHSHVPFARYVPHGSSNTQPGAAVPHRSSRKVGGVWFINTGSVGRPDDGDPRGCYAMLTLAKGVLRVMHHRVDYDIERAVSAIRDNRLPEEFAQMILRGRSLNDVESEMRSAQDAKKREPAGPKGTTPPARKRKAVAKVVDSPKPATELAGEMEPLDPKAVLPAVQKLADACGYERQHTMQVTRLAMGLFDQLSSLHKLSPADRLLLQCAANLHDIGWVEGRKGHHKAALRIILQSPLLPLEDRARRIIGCIARYHRKALPSEKHEAYAALGPDDRKKVNMLAACLRVADGLDQTHQGLVKDIRVAITDKAITLHCSAAGPAKRENADALVKGDLMEKVFVRRLALRWHLA